MKTAWFYAFFAVGLFFIIAWQVSAAPTVADPSTDDYPAQATDCFTRPSVGYTPPTTTWTVIAPNGSAINFVFPGNSGSQNRICLDGATSGATHIQGDLEGTPGNGTWTFRYTQTAAVGSLPTGNLVHLFTLGAKTLEIQLPIVAESRTFLWNAHLGSDSYFVSLTANPTNYRPSNDPDNAKYYADANTPGREPQAFTGNNSLASFNTATVNGSHAFNNTGDDTYTWFQYADGNNTLVADLSSLPNGQTTPKINKGDAFTGSSNATITYNNNAGTTYQHCANNSLGATCGASVFMPAGQGNDLPGAPTGPEIQGQDQIASDFRVTVSHAQCELDAVAFSVFLNDEIGPMDDMNVTIYDTRDGSVQLLIDHTEMVEFGETIWLFNRTLTAGTYAALGYLDRGGPLTQDRLWVQSFNVPRGSCDPSDLIQYHTATQTAIQNLNFNINGTRIEEIQDDLEAHRLGAIEANSMDYNGLTFGQLASIVVLLVMGAYALHQRWTLPTLAATLGILGTLAAISFSFTASLLLYVLTVWIHGFIEQRTAQAI